MAKLIPLTSPPPTKEVWEGYNISHSILLVYASGGMTTGYYDENVDECGSIEEYHWREDSADGYDITEGVIGWLELPTVEH